MIVIFDSAFPSITFQENLSRDIKQQNVNVWRHDASSHFRYFFRWKFITLSNTIVDGKRCKKKKRKKNHVSHASYFSVLLIYI
ncbi:hypothetical protein PUN28_011581 [Cardiocondyla obscurior]|uniref:Uncharacterized protein n=1 Tax=Cardiocondyla obscurior TaxID=286306 RepID=A0AAW2FHB7_9HYME